MKGIASLKKALCLLLAIVMLIPAMVACDGDEGDGTGSAETTTTSTESKTDAATTIDPNDMHDLPADLNYGGKEVSFLAEFTDMQEDEFYLEDDYTPTGELVPDAVYNRNKAVENQLNVKLVVKTRKGEYLNEVHKIDHSSGLAQYQIIADRTTNKGVLIIDNYYYNLKNFEHLNLDKNYWSSGFGDVVTFTKDAKQYLATGVVAVSLYRMMFATIYNQKALKTHGIEDPYQKIMDGEWTLDVQKAMIADTWQDKDGDGKKSEDDYFGFLSGVSTSMDPYLVASGVELIKKDPQTYNWNYDEDELSYLVEVADKVQALTLDDNTFCLEKDKDHPSDRDIIDKFAEGDAVMATILFYGLEKGSGEINFDYGIAPIPKYSTEQKEYRTYVQDMVTSLGVNSAVKSEEDLEAIGATLEALAYHSTKWIEEAYFQKAMSSRFLKDPRSQAIVDIMYKSVAIDFCGMMSSCIEEFKLRDQLRPILSSDGSVTTLLAKNKTVITRALSRTINKKANALP